MRTVSLPIIVFGLLAVVTAQVRGQGAAQPEKPSRAEETWQKIAFAFQAPPALAGDLGHYRSPLVFDDGGPVKTREDWRRRTQEILKFWHAAIGAWPPLIDKPATETLETMFRLITGCRAFGLRKNPKIKHFWLRGLHITTSQPVIKRNVAWKRPLARISHRRKCGSRPPRI